MGLGAGAASPEAPQGEFRQWTSPWNLPIVIFQEDPIVLGPLIIQIQIDLGGRRERERERERKTCSGCSKRRTCSRADAWHLTCISCHILYIYLFVFRIISLVIRSILYTCIMYPFGFAAYGTRIRTCGTWSSHLQHVFVLNTLNMFWRASRPFVFVRCSKERTCSRCSKPRLCSRADAWHSTCICCFISYVYLFVYWFDVLVYLFMQLSI